MGMPSKWKEREWVRVVCKNLLVNINDRKIEVFHRPHHLIALYVERIMDQHVISIA